MDKPTNLRPENLPYEPWERRSKLVLHDISNRVERATRFLRDEYEGKDLLETSRVFIFHDLFDAPRSDFGSLRRVAFFPWTELQRDMSEGLNQALLGSYKAAYDNFRRAIELAVVAAYFLQEHVPEAEGRRWVRSERDTPLFTRALTKLLVNARFRELDLRGHWAKCITAFYWRMCDIVHVRGERAGFQHIQPSHYHFNDVSLPEFSESSLSAIADTFIETTQHIATVVAIENPVLVEGLEMGAKFGVNPPLSGFFEDVQADRLRLLLLPSLRDCLLELAARDEEAIAFRQWVEGLPDLTREELEEQMRRQAELFDSIPRPDRDPE